LPRKRQLGLLDTFVGDEKCDAFSGEIGVHDQPIVPVEGAK